MNAAHHISSGMSGSSCESRARPGVVVELPQGKWVFHSWKTPLGSLVHQSETIALACPEAVGVPLLAPKSDDTNDANDVKHKRPNRRRRTVSSPATSASASTNTGSATALTSIPFIHDVTNNSTTTSNSDCMTSIHQRLTEKLSSGDKTTARKDDPDASSLKDSMLPILAPATGILRASVPTPGNLIDESSPSIVIGYIEECLHPTFLEGICVVCGYSAVGNGMPQDEDEGRTDGIHLPPPSLDSTTDPSSNTRTKKTSQVTVSGGITMTVTEEESRLIAQQGADRLSQQAKLSLVLDLDHTLVHATADLRASQFRKRDDVRILQMSFEGSDTYMSHYLKLRPHIKEFLQSVQPDYELTVYTAGTRQYAEEVIIALCRYMVGATRDIQELTEFRHVVHLATLEFEQIQRWEKQRMEQMAQNEDTQDSSTTDHVMDGTEQVAKKRKKVSFEEPQPDNRPAASFIQSGTLELLTGIKQLTQNSLERLQKELLDAEELEKQARELRQKFFGSRIVSRTDVADLGPVVKSLKRIFPCGGTMAAVVDDREDVWANAADNSIDTTIKGEPPPNLLLVRPYHWQPFAGFADVNNASGDDWLADLSALDEDGNLIVDNDRQLLWTSRILKDLHHRYYRQEMENRKSVPEILVAMRSQVLRGLTLVLSGLVPLHKKSIDVGKARPPIVRYAESLGAKLSETVEEGVTHVVAAKDGTDKCLAARRIPGCVLVKASWLVECYWSMTLCDVKPHLLDATTSSTKQPLQDSKVDNTTGTEASDDTSSTGSQDDDDFAATFEDEMMNS